MICIRCRLPLFPDPDMEGDLKLWVDKDFGEDTCYDADTKSHPLTHRHSPAYEISGALLDSIVEAVGELVEVLDRIGDEATEQYAQLAEIVSTAPKLVES